MTTPFFHIFTTILAEPLKTKRVSLSTQPHEGFILNDRLKTNNQTFMFFGIENKNSLLDDFTNINQYKNDSKLYNNITETKNNEIKKILKIRPLEKVYPLIYKNKKQSKYKTNDTIILFNPFNKIEILTLELKAKYQNTIFINSIIRQIYLTDDVKCSGSKKEHKIKIIVDIVPPPTLLNTIVFSKELLNNFKPMKTQLISFKEEDDEYKIEISNNLYFGMFEEEEVIVGFVKDDDNYDPLIFDKPLDHPIVDNIVDVDNISSSEL